jgi:putative acetyltransferase
MNPATIIRNETDADIDAITEVTMAAFETLEISNHTEQFIIETLGGTQDWYGLGPVSVSPEYQRQGIGKALVKEGLSRLKNLNATGCCVVGHPDYYRKFGFKNAPGLVLDGVPPEVFFALSFDGHIPEGRIDFHDGFKANGQQ